MKSVKQHYADHLAPVYVWMAGGADAALAAGTAEIEVLGLPAKAGDAVLDLGAGFGGHAIPLARGGARVTAVDTSHELLATLADLAGSLPIHTVEDDLISFLRSSSDRFSAILCMGDTLTHLRSAEEVRELFGHAGRMLLPGGKLIVSLRDYTRPLESESRFIPVKSDESRILTCFLEFGESGVAVHDILHERDSRGWQMQVSAYRKLRLAPESLTGWIGEAGLKPQIETGTRGMIRLVATKL